MENNHPYFFSSLGELVLVAFGDVGVEAGLSDPVVERDVLVDGVPAGATGVVQHMNSLQRTQNNKTQTHIKLHGSFLSPHQQIFLEN